MSPKSKREMVEALRAKYRRASKEERGQILDTIFEATGYNRKYVIQLLQQLPREGKRKRVRRYKYNAEVVGKLRWLWEKTGYLCRSGSTTSCRSSSRAWSAVES